MQPIGPLMIEHRLIERLLTLMAREFKRIKDNIEVDPEFAFVDPVFIDTAVDFIRTYADRCHHGKEEDLLFKALAEKNLSPEHRQTMDELIRGACLGPGGHRRVWSRPRKTISWKSPGPWTTSWCIWSKLVEFYPRHIEKEDKHFFIPCMAYFSDGRAGRLAGPDAGVRPPTDPRKIPRRRWSPWSSGGRAARPVH